jgi:4'-phosphopantetheinyl transferase
MPLVQIRKLSTDARLGLWRITESPNQLAAALAILAPALPIPPFTSQKRQREWLASRLLAYTLLQQFTPAYHALISDEYGKPAFLSSPCRLSISHSGELAAVLISSKKEVGIDLELISPRIKTLGPRFLSAAELDGANGNPEKLCILWSAKETLYKLYSKRKLGFKEHLQVGEIPPGPAGQVSARVVCETLDQEFCITYEKINDYILTYCIGE